MIIDMRQRTENQHGGGKTKKQVLNLIGRNTIIISNSLALNQKYIVVDWTL